MVKKVKFGFILVAGLVLLITSCGGLEDPAGTGDLATLISAISTADDLKSNTGIGTGVGQVSQAASTAFAEVIVAAEAVRDNPNRTQQEIDTAIANLETATTAFKAAIIPVGPGDLATLTSAIATADDLKANTGVGTEVGQVPQAASTAFADVIVAAEAVRDNPNRTQQEIDTAIANLVAATTVFKAAIITAGTGDADTTLLDAAIVKANELLNGTGVGDEVGMVSLDASGAYAIAITAAGTASTVASSQAYVDAALVTLNAATATFRAAIIKPAPIVYPTTLPTAPTLPADRVISLYTSHTYTDLAWTQADWEQDDFVDAEVDIGGTNYIFKQHTMSGIAAFEIPATDIAGKTNLHLSYHTTDASSVEVKVVEFLNGKWEQDSIVEILHKITTTQGSWVDYDIDLSKLARTDNVKQLLFIGDSGTIFYDNMYFWGEIIDPAVPVITLLGDSTVTINEGEAYDDAGATASDDVDGDITDQIVTNNPVDTSVAGTYTVTYNVTDSDSNAAKEVSRTVIVKAPLSNPSQAAQEPTATTLATAAIIYTDVAKPAGATQATVTNFAAQWSAGFIHSTITIGSNNTMRYIASTHGAAAGIEFDSLDVSGQTKVHIDWYVVGDINQITLQFVGGVVAAVEPVMTPTKDSWIPIDLTLSELSAVDGSVPDWSALTQIGLTFYGEGEIADPESRVYIDNIYFY